MRPFRGRRQRHYEQIEPLAGRENKVKEFTSHLVEAFRTYLDGQDDESIGYMEGFLAAHNFHAAVVFDLEQREDMPIAVRRMLRNMATATFTERLEREPTHIPEDKPK